LKHATRILRPYRTVAPERGDDAIDRDDAADVEKHERDQRALLLPAERKHPSILDDLERTQDPDSSTCRF
jgi:hypothetical protein